MNNTININNVKQVQTVGIKALTDALGAVGTVRFLMQFDSGEGDYAKEREQALDGMTMQDVMKALNVE